MKVKLLNKEELENNGFFKKWGEITSVCYNSPKENAVNIAKKCLESGHLSGSRAIFFVFEISGISRALSLQLNRHEVGVVKQQQSQRYVDQLTSTIVIPEELKPFKYDVYKVYERCIDLYSDLINAGISKDSARYILPEGIETSGVWAFNLEALINFMHKRLCSRASWEHRKLANMMKDAILEAIPELDKFLVPSCKYLTWCPEGELSCGLMPTRKESQ